MRSQWKLQMLRRWSYITLCRPIVIGMCIASISELPHIGKPTYDVCLLYVLGGYGSNDVIDYHQVLNWLLLLLPCIWYAGDFTVEFSTKGDLSYKLKWYAWVKNVFLNFSSVILCFISTLLGHLTGCFLWGVKGWSLQQMAISNLTFAECLLQALILVALLYINITFTISVLDSLFFNNKGAELLGGLTFLVLLFSPKMSSNTPRLSDLFKVSMLFQTNTFSSTGVTFYNAVSIQLITLIAVLGLFTCIYVYKNNVCLHCKSLSKR